jgi:hypothetical protein
MAVPHCRRCGDILAEGHRCRRISDEARIEAKLPKAQRTAGPKVAPAPVVDGVTQLPKVSRGGRQSIGVKGSIKAFEPSPFLHPNIVPLKVDLERSIAAKRRESDILDICAEYDRHARNRDRKRTRRSA